MTSAAKPRSPGLWYQSSQEEDGELLVGILFRATRKAALFDMLYEAGYFPGAREQEKERFMRTPPGRPVYLPGRMLETLREHYEINPMNHGRLYRNELEAHRALQSLRNAKSQERSSA